MPPNTQQNLSQLSAFLKQFQQGQLTNQQFYQGLQGFISQFGGQSPIQSGIQQAQGQASQINQGIMGLLGSGQQQSQQGFSQAPKSSSVTIPQGATLSSLAQQYGTTIQELMKLNPQINNPNLIFAGQKLNIPGGQQQPQQALTSPTDIAQQANQFGQQFFEQLPAEVPERESTKLLNQFMEQFLSQEIQQPELPNRQKMFADLRGELGVEPLETRLSQVESQIEQEQQNFIKKLEEIEANTSGKSAGAIEADKRKAQTESQRFLADLSIERNSVARQLDSKMNIIGMTMEFADADFKDAESRFESQWNRQKDIMGILFKMEDREISAEERDRDNALANINTITSLLDESGKSFADLNPNQLRSVRQWELQAGLPMGTYENLFTGRPDKMLTSGSRTAPDGTQYFDFIFEKADGTRYMESIPRGQVNGVTPPASMTFDEFVKQRFPQGTPGKETMAALRAEYDAIEQDTGEPLSINQIEQFRRSYGWTPPLGFSMTRLKEFVAQNPGATPAELEEGAKKAAGLLGLETGQEDGTETGGNTLERVQKGISSSLIEGYTKEEIKTFIKNNFTEDELFKLAQEQGYDNWWTGKKKDIDRMLNALLE